jgi:hypothetical protein
VTMMNIEIGHPADHARAIAWVWFHTVPRRPYSALFGVGPVQILTDNYSVRWTLLA